MGKNENDASVSASKKKRIERQKKYENEKKKQFISKAVLIGISAVIAVLIHVEQGDHHAEHERGEAADRDHLRVGDDVAVMQEKTCKQSFGNHNSSI